jgi:NADH:ubiquinone reductase (H+-translocating)
VSNSTIQPPHVVIVGGGFGGLEVAKRLRSPKVRVTLVDRNNYHLFQPLLYQVATGGLSPANIAMPLRSILRRHKNCHVVMADVQDLDAVGKRLLLADGELSFDFLVVAAGGAHSYFGNDRWEEHAPGLKTIHDATRIRSRIYAAFEAAERETDLEIRRQLMTFIIVGGGPTGVELAGALSEIATHTLKYDFRHINPADARILLVEASEHVLGNYPPSLCAKAEEKIRSLGIEVHTKSKVTDIDSDRIHISTPQGEVTIPTRTVLWAAGVKANPLGAKVATACGVSPDRAGRVPVGPQLTVGNFDNIFVIGDLAACLNTQGKPLPGVAPVAIQQGKYLAKLIADRAGGKQSAAPFVYHDLGTMATIGRAAAVAHVGKLKLAGFVAWLLWLVIHLTQIVQFQNRILILAQWGWNYLTFNRSARLITGYEPVIAVSHSADPPHSAPPSA